jgi:hypothetical protein
VAPINFRLILLKVQNADFGHFNIRRKRSSALMLFCRLTRRTRGYIVGPYMYSKTLSWNILLDYILQYTVPTSWKIFWACIIHRVQSPREGQICFRHSSSTCADTPLSIRTCTVVVIIRRCSWIYCRASKVLL